MSGVYGNAAVNIAATSAFDANSGLFFDRDPDVVEPFSTYASGKGCITEGQYIYWNYKRWVDVGKEPLNQRA